MLNVGAGEIVIILIAALLILGPKRLPEMARIIGKFMREFRRQTDDVRTMVEREFYKMDEEIVKPLEDVNPERNLILPPDNGHDPAHDRPDHHEGNALDPSVATTQHLEPVKPSELAQKTEPEALPVVAPPPTAVSRERARELAAAAHAAPPSQPSPPPAAAPANVTVEPEKN
ncbi:MAG: twin-arginine translocase TatA/TatE family subunit [Myxococcaceae bacterium]